MDTQALDLACKIHGALASGAVLVLWRFADRSSLFDKSVGSIESLLGTMRDEIFGSLESELSPVFERAGAEPKIVTTSTYTERPVNPLNSEAYKEALRAFIDSRTGLIATYGRVLAARDAWTSWARRTHWIATAFLASELACLAIVGLAGRVYGVDIPQLVVSASYMLSGMLIAAMLWGHVAMTRHQNAIEHIRSSCHGL
jgi:hypothetical protein